MKIPIEVDMLSNGKVVTGLPTWFQPNKYNSMAKWLIMLIERAIWSNYLNIVKSKLEDIKLI